MFSISFFYQLETSLPRTIAILARAGFVWCRAHALELGGLFDGWDRPDFKGQKIDGCAEQDYIR